MFGEMHDNLRGDVNADASRVRGAGKIVGVNLATCEIRPSASHVIAIYSPADQMRSICVRRNSPAAANLSWA